MSSRQVLQAVGERCAAIERLRDEVGIHTGELEKDMRVDGEDCRPHFGRMLVQELICGDDPDAELAGFGQHGFYSPVGVGDKVLDLVAIYRVERPFVASEERVLEHGEDKAAQGESLLAELSFLQIYNDPMTLVHRFLDRKRGTFLPHDVPEARIGGERRRLIQYRLPHRGPHRLARLVVAGFEVLPDLCVHDFLQARCSETAVREKRRELDKREPVRGEDVQRISKQLIRPSAEVLEMPAVPQNLGEFSNPNKVRQLLLQRVEPDRQFGITGSDNDESVAQVTTEKPLAGGNGVQKERRRVAVEIEIREPAVRLNILRAHELQERALASSRFADDSDMHRPITRAQQNSTASWLAVMHAETDIEKTIAGISSTPTKAIPNG